MENTNLNYTPIKTNLDDNNNIYVKNNFVDTNNYVNQNIHKLKENKKYSIDKNDEKNEEYMMSQRARNIMSAVNPINDTLRKKVNPISESERYKITRINVDSRYREKNPKNILESVQHILPENPLYFQNNSKFLTIYDPNHGYNYDDKIVLQNLSVTFTQQKLVFDINSYYIKVEYENHNLNPSNSYLVLIDSFIGNNTNNTLFDNILVNYINKIQNVYFSNETQTADNNSFYIKINVTPILNNTATVNVRLFAYNGIPLNQINSNYPININQTQSYLTISKIISPNYYQVALNSSATVGLADNTNLTNLIGVVGTGGGNITISKIIDVIEGFPDANNFKYNLGRNFTKVSKIKLLSTEIPNTEKVIKKYPVEKQNNLLYWQNVADGDHIYSIEVTPGNYAIDNLATAIQSQIILTPRVNQIKNINPNKIINLNNHFATVVLNQEANTFEISYYTTSILTQALKKSTYIFDDGYNRMVVNHINHGLNPGDTILIQNAVTVDQIPQDTLNGTFTIETIIDVDNYQVKLDKYNSETVAINNLGGGNAIQVLTPLQTRLLFNVNGTLGNILGFRNVNSYNAVTVYSKKITNYTEYELDTNLNTLGIFTQDLISNNVINLSGDNYIYLTINYIFKDTTDVKTIKNIFAKLLLSGSPNTVIYNDFIQLGHEFLEKINSLNELQFTFYSPDGNLFSFNNIELSFTIEIYEEIN